MTKDHASFQQSEQAKSRGYHWDQEVKRIAEELVYLKQRFFQERNRTYFRLVSLKISVVRLHIELEQALERLKEFTGRELLLLPRDSAIIKWARLFVDKTLYYFRLSHGVKSKSLWLNLLAAKLDRHQKSPAVLDPHGIDFAVDLVELPLRYKALCNTESQLRQSIEERKQVILQLTDQYHAQQVATANREARQSLNGRLGTNLENAGQSPYVKSLGRLVAAAVAPVKNPRQYQYLEQLLSGQEDQQRQMLMLCRKIADGGVDHGVGDSLDMAALKDQLALQLRQAQEMESEVIKAYKTLLAPDCPAFHPIIVQNLPKKATNMEEDFAHSP